MKKYKNIVITGGAGFIGSHMCDFLIGKKHNVTIIDNLSFGKREYVNKKAKFIKGDIMNKKLLIKHLINTDAVYHFAAMSRSGPSDHEIEFCIEQNTIGTKNVLEACRINKVKKIIYAGSSTYYGDSFGKQKETDKHDLFNPYALSKFLGEELCLFYNNKSYVESNVLRYFNVYGDRQPTSGIYALVIGIFLDRKKRGIPLIIFGDGNQRRDFIHVDDVVKANYKVLNTLKNGEVYNVGFGKNFSINELAKLISKKIKYAKKRKGEPRETLANINKLKKLNWKPQISLKEGVKRLLKKSTI